MSKIPAMETAWQSAATIGRAYLWSILLWGSFAPVMAGQEKVRLLENGFNTPYWKLLLVTGAWNLTAAILTPPIFSIVHRFPITRPKGLRRVGGYLLGAGPYLIASLCVRGIVLPPWDSATQQFTARSFQGLLHNADLFALQTWDYLVIVVVAHAYEYYMRARDQELERAELQRALAGSELQALKSQLQPHFLFNTLHGISTLIEVDKARAKTIVLKLSDLLRTALQHGNSDLITLEEELKFVKAYLEIEQMRLGGRLEMRWEIERRTLQLLVPQLILQPLVENGIVHGVACSREGGWLEIGLKRSGNRVALTVRNTVKGKGTPGSGLGLQNTKARLKYLYSDEASLSFAIGDDEVATATIFLPTLGAEGPEIAAEPAELQARSAEERCAS
ncbi:MAG: histidine kinase [Candidatus Acidiferrum sp.]